MAVARGLNERSAFWLGFCLWFVGLIIVAAAKPHQTAEQARSQAAAPPPPRPAAPATPDKVGRLKELATLREQGAITDEEFERLKAEVISGADQG
jgi:hypothetical protein